MNVLLITTDQQRADTIGAYGSRLEATPALDRLAAEGVRFDLCRTQNPYCQPARATILTGRYPSSHGVHSNGVDFPQSEVGTTLSAMLAAAGWTTAFRGKAHFASTYPRVPTGALESVEGSAAMPENWRGPYMGFADVDLILFGHHIHPAGASMPEHWGPPPRGLHYARWLFRDGEEAGRRRLELMTPAAALRPSPAPETWASALPEEDHPTTYVAERTVAFLRTVDRGRPWFCWASFTDPHHPMDPPAPWCDRYTAADMTLPIRRPEELERKPPFHRLWTEGLPGPLAWANPGGARLSDRELAELMAAYYGLVAQLDHAIGRILAALEDTGQAEDTLVVCTTDHGELLGDHQMLFKGRAFAGTAHRAGARRRSRRSSRRARRHGRPRAHNPRLRGAAGACEHRRPLAAGVSGGQERSPRVGADGERPRDGYAALFAHHNDAAVGVHPLRHAAGDGRAVRSID